MWLLGVVGDHKGVSMWLWVVARVFSVVSSSMKVKCFHRMLVFSHQAVHQLNSVYLFPQGFTIQEPK